MAAPSRPAQHQAPSPGLFDRIPVGVYRTTPDGQILAANSVILDILGYPDLATLQQARVQDIYVDPSQRAEWQRRLEQEQDVRREDLRLKRKDGRVVVVSDTANAVRDEAGETLYYEGILEDVTERVAAEEALRESEQRFRRLVEALPEAVVVHSGNQIVYANPSAASIVGAEREEELMGRTLLDFVHPDYRDMVIERIRRTQQLGEHGELVEERLLRQDGTPFDAEVIAMPITYQGRPASLVLVRDISERVAAEGAVRDSEARLRSSFDHASIGMALVDLGGRYTQVNRAFCELLGYPEEELVGRGWQEVTHPGDVERSSAPIEAAKAGGLREWELEKRFVRKDGRTVWVLLSVSLVYDDQGHPIHFFSQFQDITERKLVEEALVEQEERYRMLFNRAPVALWEEDFSGVGAFLEKLREEGVTDLRAYFEEHPDELARAVSTIEVLRANRAAVELIEAKSEAELLAGHISLEDRPESVARGYVEQFAAIWEGRDRVEVEAEDVTLRGNRYYAMLHQALPVSNGALDLSRTIVAMLDFTQRKRVEEERARLTAILETTSDLVAIVDPRGRFLHLNRAAREFLGIDLDGALPPRLSATEAYPPDIRNVLTHEVLPALDRDGIWSGELAILHHERGEIPVSQVVIAHRTPDGEVSHYSSIVRDITERKRVEQRLEELVRSKDEFVASVSHEVRTPLTAVVGLAQELRDEWDRFILEERQELVGMVAEQSMEVANIVEDLLVAARADIGKVTVVAGELDLVEQVHQVMSSIPDCSGVRLELEGPVRAWGDPARVRQVIRNLLTNAIRYGGDRIEVEAGERDDLVWLRVSDDGPGIPEEEQERIFEPYYRTRHREGQPASVGLGLTVSRQLARLMGGDLTYRFGEGASTFELTLPQADA